MVSFGRLAYLHTQSGLEPNRTALSTDEYLMGSSTASRTPPRAFPNLPKSATSDTRFENKQASITEALQPHQDTVTAWNLAIRELRFAGCRVPTVKDAWIMRLPYYQRIEACRLATLEAHARLAEECRERQTIAVPSAGGDPSSYEEATYDMAVDRSYEEEVKVTEKWDWLRWSDWRVICRHYKLLPVEEVAQDRAKKRRKGPGAEVEEEDDRRWTTRTVFDDAGLSHVSSTHLAFGRVYELLAAQTFQGASRTSRAMHS